MFRFTTSGVRAAVAAAVCILGLSHATSAAASMIGGTITVRIDDEYYAFFTQTQGGASRPMALPPSTPTTHRPTISRSRPIKSPVLTSSARKGLASPSPPPAAPQAR